MQIVKKLSEICDVAGMVTVGLDNVYVEEAGMEFVFSRDSVVIVDLENAMKTGKTCHRWSFVKFDAYGRNIVNAIFKENKVRADDFADALKTGAIAAPDDIRASEYEERSCDVFSPFVKVRAQNLATQMTAKKFVKAVLAGQYKAIVTDMYFTDDYRSDAAENFRKGWEVDMLDFAAKIYKRPQGWWFVKNPDGSLDVCCYDFAYYTAFPA